MVQEFRVARFRVWTKAQFQTGSSRCNGPTYRYGLEVCVDPERERLAQIRTQPWRRWGPYLSERQWGTVREDYSQNGDAWNYFTHEQARSRAYRWGEDGIAGICDDQQVLCFAIALWNGNDPIL